MITKYVLLPVFFSILLISCSKNESGTNPPAETPSIEDWSFHNDSTKYSITASGPTDTMKVGTTFDIKLILYNVSSVFSCALEMNYVDSVVNVTSVILGPFLDNDSVIVLQKIEPGLGRISFGATYKAGKTLSSQPRSGIIAKLKCRTVAQGTAAFSFNSGKFQILTSTGGTIPNYYTFRRENLTVFVR